MKHHKTTKMIRQASVTSSRSGSRAIIRSFMIGLLGKSGCAITIIMALAMAGTAVAQTTNYISEYSTNSTTVTASVSSMKILPNVRMTVPVSTTASYAGDTITFTLGGAQINQVNSVTNDSDPLNVYITNYFEVNPAVATLAATGVPSTGGGSGVAFAVDSVTNYSSGNLAASVGVTFNYTNLTSGEYDMAIEAASANTWRFPLPVTAGYQWASTAAAGGTAEGANWVGGAAPGAGDYVIIPDVTIGNATTPSILVTNNTEIAALRDTHIGNSTFPNYNIADGVTLAITGDGGYRQLNDQLEDNNYGYLQASGAGTLLVSNANASFQLYATRQNTQNRFFFDQLNTLKVDVKRIAIDDIWAYPNYGTNGNASRPYRMVATVRLATNNIFHATQTDANGWSDQRRDYSFVIARAQSGGGSGTDFGIRLGNYNEFDCDSVLFGGAGDQCDSGSSQEKEIDFSPSMAGTKQLVMRGTNGGATRMANWTMGDNATPNGSAGQGCKINVLLTAGSIDALVDRLYMARNATNSTGANTSGRLDISAGTLDVNDAYLGYQQGSDAVVGGSTGVGYCQGTINLSGTATFIVNSNLVLGYTEATSASAAFQPQTGYGQLNLSGTAVAYINDISAGGVSGATLDNANQKVTIGGGTLVLSNKMGSVSSPVNTLSLSGGGILSLPNLTSPGVTNVFVKNLAGSGGVISLPGLTSGGTYIIASYSDTAAITWTLDLPSGYYGFLTIDPSANLVKAVISTSPPKTCVWVGYPGTDWDTTSLNWKELTSGNPTNFSQGDAVLFDDSASNATVNVALAVIPAGGTTITNDTLNYTFTGANIEGTGGTIKTGVGSLTIGNTHYPLMTVDGGSLVVNGTLRGGLTVNGASVQNGGTINGAVNLATTGASLDNSGTITTTPSALAMVAGCSITNNASGTINNGSSSDTTYPSGSTFVNKGQINNLAKRISVNGVWINDGGIITDNTAVDDTTGQAGAGRFTMQTTGELYIGANGIIVQGRFDNILGSRTYINVDKGASPTSQKVLLDYFGDMRGTFVMNNIGATPYANGDSFTVMQQEYNIAKTNANNAANQVPMVSPGAAGVGLQWDVSGMLATTTTPPPSAIRTIAVVTAPTTPPELTAAYSASDLVISWASTNVSYQLQVQTNDLSTGIYTNWVPIVGSENTNSWSVTIDPAAPTVFYRLSNQ